MRNGAVDFLQKPFTVDEITSALSRALTQSTTTTPSTVQPIPDALTACYQSLTPRETEVFQQIVAGVTNKEIARTLSISPRTVEVHRQKIMTKMNAANLAELVRMAVLLGVDGGT